MRELAPDDEKRLESLRWLQGALFRGAQVDADRRDVSLYAISGEFLVELMCEDASYLALPNLFDRPGMARIVGLVVQPQDEALVVRLEFSDHPAQVHLQCQRLVVRKDPNPSGAT